MQRSEKPVYTNLSVGLPVTLILLAETFFFFGELHMTLILHIVNISLCVLLPLAPMYSPSLFQAFCLVSLLRILNISMPVFFPYTLYWLPFIYGATLLGVYFVVNEREIGTHWEAYYLPVGVFFGWLLANFEYNILATVEALIPTFTLVYVLLAAGVMLFLGTVEELVFRSVLQTRLHQLTGPTGSVVLASVVFSSMHSGYSSIAYLVFVFLISLFLGSLFHKTKSLALIALIHGSLNFFLFSLLPYNILLLNL